MVKRAKSMSAWNVIFLVVAAGAGLGFKINDQLLIVDLLNKK